MFSLSPPHVVIFSIRAGKNTFTMTENPSTRDWSAVRHTDRFPPLQKKLFYIYKKKPDTAINLMRFSQPDAPHSMFPHMQALPCTSLHFSMTQSTGIRRRPFPSYGTNGRLQTLHLNEESCSEVKLCAPMNFKPSFKKKRKKKATCWSLVLRKLCRADGVQFTAQFTSFSDSTLKRSVWHVRRSAPPARANEILNK